MHRQITVDLPDKKRWLALLGAAIDCVQFILYVASRLICLNRWFGLLLLGSVVLSVWAEPISSLSHILEPYQEQTDIGIVVQRLDNGRFIYQQNARRLYTPASVIKLFIASAALHFLGGQFRFQTLLLANANPDGAGVLQGDLRLRFSGDPSLTDTNLGQLFSQLRKFHIRHIKGNVYIDASAFDDDQYGPGWMWDELNTCYAAPINSILINKNCVHASIQPSVRAGLPGTVIVEPMNRLLIGMLNETVTRDADLSDCPLHLAASTWNNYTLSGCVPIHARAKLLEVALRNTDLYSKRLIKQLLKQYNIHLAGHVIVDRKSQNIQSYHLLAVHQSSPLKDLIQIMLKHSDNVIAGALHKTIGAYYFHTPGSWRQGNRAMIAILKPLTGIDFTQVRFKETVGLSRYDLITPYAINKLLYYIYHDTQQAKLLVTALPVAGVDGTLKDRMRYTGAFKRVRAKTGNMTGVSALAGYATTQSGIPVSFVMMANGFVLPQKAIYQLEDKFCDWLTGYSLP